MFPQVSVYHSVQRGGGGPIWPLPTITTSLYSPPHPSMGPHGTPDIWWPSLETCSNLFTWGPQPRADNWWRLLKKYVRSAQSGDKRPTGMLSYYRPQRSWGKVIFSQASVVLFTGEGGLPQYMLGYRPPPQTRQAPARDQAGTPQQSILGGTVNERAVCILLEYNLVFLCFYVFWPWQHQAKIGAAFYLSKRFQVFPQYHHVYLSVCFVLFFFKFFGRHKSFLWGHWYLCFGLLDIC